MASRRKKALQAFLKEPAIQQEMARQKTDIRLTEDLLEFLHDGGKMMQHVNSTPFWARTGEFTLNEITDLLHEVGIEFKGFTFAWKEKQEDVESKKV